MAKKTRVTPIEIMSAAHDAEYERWSAFMNSPLDALDTQLWGNPRLDTQRWAERYWHEAGRREIFKLSADATEATAAFEKMRRDASWRAALRALAEMEPSLPMYEETKLHAATMFTCLDECKAYILAAAAEGEQP